MKSVQSLHCTMLPICSSQNVQLTNTFSHLSGHLYIRKQQLENTEQIQCNRRFSGELSLSNDIQADIEQQ